MTSRETLIALATERHDRECGCDRKYRMSCPRMAQMILSAEHPAAQVPQRCGQRHTTLHSNAPSVALTCTLAAEHSGTFHRADDGSTWSSAGDLQGPPSLQHDACGARLTIGWSPDPLLVAVPAPMKWTCALGPHDADDRHRAADGTQWRASDFPPTAPGRLPLCGMASSPADGWYGVCDRPAGHDGGHRQFDDPDPKGTAALVELLRERGELIAKYRAALSRKGECTCEKLTDRIMLGDDDELCPRHGTVAELVTQLRWASSFTERIMGALGEPWTEPFHGGDAAEEVARRIELGDVVDNVNAELTAAGIDYPHGSAGVRDLAMQRDGNAEHAENAEAALTRIADMARQTMAAGDSPDAEATRRTLACIFAVTQEKNR